jgi:ABC-type lipoprotein release transport system permease subunit
MAVFNPLECSRTVNYPSFTVAGIYHGGTALEAGTVIMPLDQLQQLSSLHGKITAFHLRLRPLPARRSRRASLTGRGAAA